MSVDWFNIIGNAIDITIEISKSISNAKKEFWSKTAAMKRTFPMFIAGYHQKRYCVYGIYVNRHNRLMNYAKEGNEAVEIPSQDCKSIEFCSGGKEELANFLSGIRMTKDRMDDLRFFCNAIGMSEQQQEDIRELLQTTNENSI